MMDSPARSILLVLAITGGIIALVTFGGALVYKNSDENKIVEFQQAQETEIAEIPQETATLALVPTNTPRQYQLVLEGLSASVTSVAFELEGTSEGIIISSSNITLDQSIRQKGWSAAVNSSSSSNAAQTLSLSMIRTSAEEESTSEPTFTIGTITLAEGRYPTELTLNPDESYITYFGNDIPAVLTLIVKNANNE